MSFNVETPQGIATTDSPTFAGLTAAGLVYPTTDGTASQVIVTDGAGNLSFATVGGGASALDDLTDVTITTVANDNILRYNSTSSQWENVAINTDKISEGSTNLYYTDARTRAALSAGTGINFNSTNGVITNSSPDQTVVLTAGTGISTSGTYPNFTITNSSPDQTVKLTAGTGISTSGTYPNFTITNSSPDQTVTLTAGSGISVTGTYPSFTIGSTINQYTDSDARKSISAGTGISYNSTTGIITNSSPDQTVTLTAGTGISVTGTYPSFTITNSSPSSGGTVTSVGLSAPTGMKVTNSPITSSGTIALSMDTGYALPTSASQTNWDTAYTNRITSLTTTGSSGSATLVSNTLNVPTYTLAGLGGIKLTDLSSTATGLTYTNTTGVFSFTSGYSIPTNSSQTNWDSAYYERRQWDGGSTNLVAATGRTSLGGTTVGSNLFTLTNPSAVTFLKVNADNTVTAESASTFRTSIGAGTGNGTITSIATTSPITGGTITSTGTIGINASSTNTASYVVQRDASGNFSAGTITASLSGNATSATNIAGGGAGQLPYNTGSGATSFLAAGTSGQILRSNGSSSPTWEVQGLFHSGRLTLESNVPVSTTDQASKATIYYTPYNGDRISLYDGTNWATYTFSQLSLALGTLSSGFNYDVFVYNNAGTLTLETAVWTNDTIRATSLTLTNGIYLKTGALTRRYLGTFRTTSTTATEDSLAKRYVWNFNNKVLRSLYVGLYIGLNHTYNGNAREWNNGTNVTRLQFITGIDGETFIANGVASITSGGFACNAYFGVDSTTAQFGATTTDDRAAVFTRRSLTTFGQINSGYHYMTMIQSTESAGTSTFLDVTVGGALMC